MVLFNYSTRELTAKIVYYGPGLCGKTTNLQFIYDNMPSNVKGKMLSLATKTDRTLFFDFLPLDLGEIRGMKTRMQLYTVPGQVFYNETRRLVLKGADGVVFVADSQKQMMDANRDSLRNLEENLKAHGVKLSEIPIVLQFNKRDLPNVASIEELNAALNGYNAPFYESVATTGIGVQDTLKAISKLVLLNLTRKYDVRRSAARPASAPAPATPVAKAPAAATPAALEGIPVSAPAPPAAQGIPVSAAATVAAASDAGSPAPPAAMSATPATMQADEPVVDLVDVVEEIPSAAAPPTPAIQPLGATPAPAAAVAAQAGNGDGAGSSAPVEIPVHVTGAPSAGIEIREVDDRDALFNDGQPVARVDGSRPAEVAVPIEVHAGGSVRRFRLRVSLNVSEVSDSND